MCPVGRIPIFFAGVAVLSSEQNARSKTDYSQTTIA